MAAGLPVVASDRTSLPEIYQDGALYFNPSDPADIKNKIAEVINNQKVKADLIAAGKIISQHFSWNKAAQETLKIYEEILK